MSKRSSTRTDREFTITRVLESPRELVFQAWTQPEQVARWWGPRDFTTPLSSITMDVRPGGTWSARMISDADGTEYPTGGVYREVVEPERLVFTWGVAEGPGMVKDESLVTVTFTSIGNKTEMTFHQAGFTTTEERTNVYEGWVECLDRLAEHVA